MSKTLSEQFDEEFDFIDCSALNGNEIKKHLLQSHIDICNEEIKRLKDNIIPEDKYIGIDNMEEGINHNIDEEIKHHAQRRETLLEELNTLV